MRGHIKWRQGMEQKKSEPGRRASGKKQGEQKKTSLRYERAPFEKKGLVETQKPISRFTGRNPLETDKEDCITIPEPGAKGGASGGTQRSKKGGGELP